MLGEAALHLVEVEHAPTVGEPRLEHFAFKAEGLADFRAVLDARGVDYELAIVPGWEIRQVHLRDPDGNHIEVSFDPTEPLAAAGDGAEEA